MKLRFSIRDLLWLTAFLAALVAWWIDSRRLASERDAFQRDFKKVENRLAVHDAMFPVYQETVTRVNTELRDSLEAALKKIEELERQKK